MKRLWLGAVPLCLFAVRAEAVVTATWTVETYQQFDAGDATSAFITSTGELRPGWNTKRVKLEGSIAVVSLAQTADGTLWAGAMPCNKIWKLDTAGKATPGPALKDVETI